MKEEKLIIEIESMDRGEKEHLKKIYQCVEEALKKKKEDKKNG